MNRKTTYIPVLLLALLLAAVPAYADGLPPEISIVQFDPDIDGYTSGLVTVSAEVTDDSNDEGQSAGVDTVEFSMGNENCFGVNVGGDIYECEIDSTLLDDRDYTLFVEAEDLSSNEALDENLDLTVDNEAPETFKNIEEYFFITTDTEIEFFADDDGVGVETTFYRFYACEDSPAPAVAFSEFDFDESFSIPDEGCHEIEFFSVDRLGNEEEHTVQQHFVDDTGPTVIKNIENQPVISPFTTIELAVDDGEGIGIDNEGEGLNGETEGVLYYTAYFCEDEGNEFNSVESESVEFTVNEFLETGDGDCITLEFFAVDDLGNEGNTTFQDHTIDFEAPETTISYGEPNTEATLAVPTCEDNFEEGSVDVNGHIITTDTLISLDATDNNEVGETFFRVWENAGCDDAHVEWVGMYDKEIYETLQACENAETEGEGQQPCIATFWTSDSEDEQLEGRQTYEGPFSIEEESLHKVCFYSVDAVGNEEEIQCKVALVDAFDPVINSVEVEHMLVDLENYEQGNRVEFQGPKCAIVTVDVTETNVDSVSIDIERILREMLVNVGKYDSFDEEDFESFLENLDTEFFDGDDGIYKYHFCPSRPAGEDIQFMSIEDTARFMSQDLVLGNFETTVTVTDEAGRSAEAPVSFTVVDLTVPLEVGWNLRSTPIALDGEEFHTKGGIDAVLKFNGETQLWELVLDMGMEPLEGYFMHATERNQYGLIIERGLTSPPSKQLGKEWNLVGMTVPLTDSFHFPFNCEPEGYDTCHVSQLRQDDSMCVGDGFASVVYTSDGNRGVEQVVAPTEDLDYETDWGNWNFGQAIKGLKVWIPDIEETGASPDNECEDIQGENFPVKNFGGYWAFMSNPDTLGGFTSTPLFISTEDDD